MQHSKLATRYAKSLIDIAIEQNVLDSITDEVKALKQVVARSSDLRALLRSPVIKGDKKSAILDQVFKGKLSTLMHAFIQLLVKKGRESVLVDILHNYMEQYDEIKGINHVKLTTAAPVDDATRNAILASIEQTTNLSNVVMDTAIDASLIGGYVLEMRDYLVDASIKRELALVKRGFTSNEYTYNIR